MLCEFAACQPDTRSRVRSSWIKTSTSIAKRAFSRRCLVMPRLPVQVSAKLIQLRYLVFSTCVDALGGWPKCLSISSHTGRIPPACQCYNIQCDLNPGNWISGGVEAVCQDFGKQTYFYVHLDERRMSQELVSTSLEAAGFLSSYQHLYKSWHSIVHVTSCSYILFMSWSVSSSMQAGKLKAGQNEPIWWNSQSWSR